jgi:hypothetical protein
MFVVRVEADVTSVAVVDTARHRIERARHFSAGLNAVDDRIEEIIDASLPGGLPGSSAAAFVAARARMRDSISAARLRLVEDESTVVSVRFPGRTTFVTLDRSAVVDALAAPFAQLVAALAELGAGARSTIVPLDGVGAVPGLREALPGRLDDLTPTRAADLRVLLDAMDPDARSEGAVAGRRPGPDAPPAKQTAMSISVVPRSGPSVPRAVVTLRRAWPPAAAVVLLLGVGGTAAAVGLGDRSDDVVRPIVAGTGEHDALRSTPAPADTDAPAGASGGGAPPSGDSTGGPGGPGVPKKTTGGVGTGSRAPDAGVSGAAPVPAPAPVAPGPAPVPSSPPVPSPTASPSPTDPAVPDPTPTGPPPSDPGGGLLGNVLGAVLPILP